ncbi:Microtubule associated protein [Mycena chlorophos]|uniref:Microtubule associated protein n=1 Tax=Mycena chlorophos TaxID=658473 RepID=A0A8H6TSJ4_MYCCL|nr:Microtubule associated protein [Mycena chlorophos]
MDGPPAVEEDFSPLPISERLQHKNWKARVSAYEALVKIFEATASDDDPAFRLLTPFRPYINSDLLKKIVSDSNAVAQERGLECVVALLKFAGETAARTRDAVVPALVDKCFGSTRAGTKTQAIELALQYVEVENGGAAVVNDILPGLSAKQPKAVAGTVLALKEIIRLFGVQTTPPPPILKALPKIFGHSDKTVRAEGIALAHVLYQYLGPGLEPWLADLKPVQVKELKEAFESMEASGKGKGTVKPERMTRAHAREAQVAEDAGETAADTEENEEPAAFDPLAFVEPVDIKLPASLHSLLTSSKWKERKEVLDELLTSLNSTPRIKDGPEIGEVSKALAVRIQSDANVNCVMTAANCLEALAKAMKGSFARYRESVVALMLERMKERKASVTDAIGAALDAVFATTMLSDIIPDLGSALGSKNPQVKEGTLKFLGRCLSTATAPIQPGQVKGLAESLAGLLEDSFEGARNEAATCLGTLMKMVGERPLNPVMEGLADVRKAKVKEAFEKATVKCKAGAAAPPKAAAPPPAAAPPKKKAPAAAKPPPKPVVQDDEPSPPSKPAAKPPAAKPPVKKPAPPAAAAPVAKKAPPAAAGKPSKGAPAPAAGGLDTFKYKHTPEDAEALAAETIPANILTDLADSKWKTRLTALEEMTTWIEGVIDEVDAEVIVRALGKKGWSDSNFQVVTKIYGICGLLAEKCPSFGRSCVALAASNLCDKLGDVKLKKPAGDTLLTFAEKTSLQFVLNQAYEPLGKQKAPKVLADALTWVNTALLEFGIAGLSLRGLIEFLKTALQNSNAAVRTNATKTLVTVKLYAGSSIKDFLEDLNPQLLNTINSEFDKVEGQSAPEPERTSADLANMATSSSTTNGAAVGGGDPLDDLFPRVEIDGLMKGTTILADAKSDSWKTKKEALEGLQAILDQGSNKRLKPAMGEIGQVLKARVTDTNKAVQTLALDIVARIATGMGKPFEKHSRLFAQPVASVLADQKAPIRASAIQTLTAIATACEGLESMVAGLHTALETTNPLQKGTLLHWVAEWLAEHAPGPALDLSSWASAVVGSLDDRNPDVRKGAQALLPALIASAGFDHVLHQTNSLKPASRNSAVPLIQAARPAAEAAAPPPKAAPAKPPPVSTARASVSPPLESPPVTAGGTAKPAASKLGVRRKLPTTTSRPESRSETPVELPPRTSKLGGPGLRRPGGTSSAKPSAPSTPPPSVLLVLSGTNLESKKTRCGKDSSKWINEGGPTRKDLAEALQTQMEPHASKDLVAQLFSHDHNAVNDHIAGLTSMSELFSGAVGDSAAEAVCLANFDLAVKYASIKMHESQPNLVSKCLEVVESVLSFLRGVNYQLTENEALCFVPTIVFKLGDAREPVRVRVQQIIQDLPKVYAYSRLFQILLDHGLKSKVAKTRQGALDELAIILKKSGMSACEPSKAFPIIGGMIADKDSSVRKSALSVLSEGYSLVGEKVWSLVGPLPPKDKTQLEERLRRVPGPSSEGSAQPAQVSRLAGGIPRPGSPATGSRIGGVGRPSSPSGIKPPRSASPGPSNLPRAASPVRPSRGLAVPGSPTAASGIGRPKSMLPSRLGLPRPKFPAAAPVAAQEPRAASPPPAASQHVPEDDYDEAPASAPEGADAITLTISGILSSDATRSVDALKKIQKILSVGPEAGPSSPQYRELAEHTEGLIETITLQMAHVFDRPEDLLPDENFRLAKHLIQTLNTFCDHPFLAESLTVDILTSLLEELTLRLLETDDSAVKKVKDLSRFINMIILRLFSTGRRMSIFRALFALLLQIVKPFPANGTAPDSKEAKVAELVLKCVWKLARNIPQDLKEERLDPVELFPAIEQFLQSVPPNEWRARATNKVPCGDMPLRTIKVIIQHVVAFYGDDVYDLLSAAFDDPSATIVYPYVYRILNSSSRQAAEATVRQNGSSHAATPTSPVSSSRPISPQETNSARHSSPSRPTSVSSHAEVGASPPQHAEEPDPDAQLLVIIGHISSETTGALHKEGITELHHFLKAYPHKRPKVDKLLDSTGAAFRKYITRALASRAAEDQERDAAVADTLQKLESNNNRPSSPATSEAAAPQPRSPRQATDSANQDKLSRLHNLFQYRSSTLSNGSGPRTSQYLVPKTRVLFLWIQKEQGPWRPYSPMSSRGTDNLRGYLREATLPPMTNDAAAPKMPAPGHKSHLNHLSVRPQSWRRLESIYPFKNFSMEEVVVRWIDTHIPETSLGVEDMDAATGERLTIPCPPIYNIPLRDERRPTNIQRLTPWIDNLPLMTVQRTIHLLYPETQGWAFDLKDTQEADTKIFQHFMWTYMRDDLPDDQFDQIGRRSVVVAFQPPWILSAADIQEFAKCRSFPPYVGVGHAYPTELESKERLWAKIWDTCVTNHTPWFVLTSYNQWVFGVFSSGWTAAFVSDVCNFDSFSPTVIEWLTFWVASAMRLKGWRHIPKVPEPVTLGPVFIPPTHNADFETPANSESNWNGKSQDAESSARARSMSPVFSDNGLPGMQERPLAQMVQEWMQNRVDSNWTPHVPSRAPSPPPPQAFHQSLEYHGDWLV